MPTRPHRGAGVPQVSNILAKLGLTSPARRSRAGSAATRLTTPADGWSPRSGRDENRHTHNLGIQPGAEPDDMRLYAAYWAESQATTYAIPQTTSSRPTVADVEGACHVRYHHLGTHPKRQSPRNQ